MVKCNRPSPSDCDRFIMEMDGLCILVVYEAIALLYLFIITKKGKCNIHLSNLYNFLYILICICCYSYYDAVIIPALLCIQIHTFRQKAFRQLTFFCLKSCHIICPSTQEFHLFQAFLSYQKTLSINN